MKGELVGLTGSPLGSPRLHYWAEAEGDRIVRIGSAIATDDWLKLPLWLTERDRLEK